MKIQPVKYRLAIVLAALVAGFAGGTVGAPVGATEPAYAKTCSSGYTHAVLPWGHKCLRAGQYCKHSADRYYHRYGYHCHKRDYRGSYHLTH
jgi:hypothetical protein